MKRWMVAARFIGVGWYIGICIVAGVGIGIWLDRTVQTGILFTLVGLGLGLILAFWGVYRMLLPVLKDKDKED